MIDNWFDVTVIIIGCCVGALLAWTWVSGRFNR